MLTRQRRISNIWSTIETNHTLPADPVVHCIHFALQLQFPQVETNWLLCQGKLTSLTAMYTVYNVHSAALHGAHCTVHFTTLDTSLCSIKCTVEYRQTAALCNVHYFLDSAVQRGPELPLLLGSRWTIDHPHILVAFHGQHFSTLRSHMDGRIPRFIRLF